MRWDDRWNEMTDEMKWQWDKMTKRWDDDVKWKKAR
jgi:hypothetical protein